VSTLARQLGTELARATSAAEGERRLLELSDEEEELKGQEEEIDRRRRELQTLLGVSLEVGNEWLSLFVDNLTRWQRATDEAESMRMQLEELREKREHAQAEAGRELSDFGYRPFDGAPEVRASVEGLEERRQRYERVGADAEGAHDILKSQIKPEIDRCQAEWERLFTDLGLELGDTRTLEQWLDRLDEYKDLSRKLERVQAVRDAASEKLSESPELLEKSAPQLEALIEQCRQEGGRLQEIAEDIGEIRHAVAEAKGGHELGDALVGLREALDGLEDCLEEDLAAVAGWMVIDHARSASVGRSRPDVFRSANRLLSDITRGRYRMEVEDADPPTFVAWDEAEEVQKELGELSTGERVQFLLAVRIGFAEHAETVARLPLIMDETLANADDERAAAIIDAVNQIARDGRQVFYFTAQPDEVEKWRSRVRDQGDDCQVIDLGEIRRLQRAEQSPLRVELAERSSVPSPKGLSHEQYGRRLQVPGLDPRWVTLGHVHLWHLVDDDELLCAILKGGVSEWGPLRSLVMRGGTEALAALLPEGAAHQADETYGRAEGRMAGIEAVFDAWQIGHGKPVDRQVLVDSQAVSDRVLDRVSELADGCGGDAAAILEQLDSGAIKYWRSGTTEKLRDYLDENGYLDDRKRLSQDEIRIEVPARADRDPVYGQDDGPWIERLVAGLPD
jgi:hypothetical protein